MTKAYCLFTIFFCFFLFVYREIARKIENLGSLIDLFCQVFGDLELKNKLGFFFKVLNFVFIGEIEEKIMET